MYADIEAAFKQLWQHLLQRCVQDGTRQGATVAQVSLRFPNFWASGEKSAREFRRLPLKYEVVTGLSELM